MARVPSVFDADFDRLFDDFFPLSRRRNDLRNFFAPQVDIEDHDDHYLIKADLPGVKKEDITVTLEDGMLTLQAEHKEESEEKKKGKVIRSERRVGKFSRSFNVPRSLGAKDINGSMDDGVLTIKVPKAKEEEEPRARQVSIR